VSIPLEPASIGNFLDEDIVDTHRPRGVQAG